jgi:hypothetical protein
LAFQFQRATKQQRKARIALIGPSGSGKTYSALAIASGMGNNIAVIDTENHSSTLYADVFDFSVLSLDTFSPETYVAAIRAAEQAGFDVLIIDSLSHGWIGKDGALEQVDKAAARSRSGNTFSAWREVTPKHNELVDTMIRCNCHLIVTMRAKTEYVVEQVQRGGKTVSAPRKIGLAPVQRDGLEYEFDLVADMDLDNNMIVSKTRFPFLNAEVVNQPGAETGERIVSWLADGAPAPQPAPQPQFAKPEKPAQKPANKQQAKPTPNTPDSDSLRKRFFAVARDLAVPSEIAKDWAKEAFAANGEPLGSFNDIPPELLSKTVEAMADSQRSKAFVGSVTTWYRTKLLKGATAYCGDEKQAREWVQATTNKKPDEATLAELEVFAKELAKASEPPAEGFDLDDVPF